MRWAAKRHHVVAARSPNKVACTSLSRFGIWCSLGARGENSTTTLMRTTTVNATVRRSIRSSVTRTSVAGELAVGHPVRPGRLDAEALDLVGLVGLEVALEPVPLRGVLLVALPRQDVGRDPVEEPPVVADDDRAAGKLQQGVLQRTEGLGVEV